MSLRVLVPSYSQKNHSDTLRFELCEIIYENYKGATFFLDDLLNEKRIV